MDPNTISIEVKDPKNLSKELNEMRIGIYNRAIEKLNNGKSVRIKVEVEEV